MVLSFIPRKTRAFSAADELFYVLEGMMVQSNPATGEVLVVKPGEATYFRRDTWHHQWNYSNKQLKMLEFFQPSPKTGSGGSYSRAQQNITRTGISETTYWGSGRWPAKSSWRSQTMWHIGENDILWRLEGGVRGRELLVGIMLSTEHVTVGTISFLGGRRSSVFNHRGDKVLVLEEGNLHIEFPEQVLGRAGPYGRLPDTRRSASLVLQHVARAHALHIFSGPRLPSRLQ